MRLSLPALLLIACYALGCGGDEPAPAGGGNTEDPAGGGVGEIGAIDPNATPDKPDRPAPPVKDPVAEMFAKAEKRIRGSDEDAQLEAVEALWESDADALRRGRLLVLALDSEHEEVRGLAAQALGEVGYKAAAPGLRSLLAREDDPLVRKSALESLSTLAGDLAFPDLIEVLVNEDENEQVRVAAARFLGLKPDEKCIKALTGALAGYNAAVRRESVAALGKLRAGSAVGSIIEVLQDASELVRAEAAKSLGLIGEKKAVPALMDAFDPEEEEDEVLQQITTSLAKLAGLKGDEASEMIYDVSKSTEELAAVAEAWKDWWEENKGDY